MHYTLVGLWLTSDEDINSDGSGADNDSLDILVIAAIVARVLGLRAHQGQPLAVRPPRLPRTLAHQGEPLAWGPGGRQLGLTVGKLLSHQSLIRPDPGHSALSPEETSGQKRWDRFDIIIKKMEIKGWVYIFQASSQVLITASKHCFPAHTGICLKTDLKKCE